MAVRRRNDHPLEGRGVGRLGVGLQRQLLGRAGDGANRGDRVGVPHRIGQRIYADAPCGQRSRVDLDAHGILLGAKNLDLAHAVQRRQCRRNDVLGIGVELGEAARAALQRQQQDGRVGGVGLAIAWGRRHVGGQLPQRAIDGRLHVGARLVDIAMQIELQDNRGRALRAGRTDRGYRRNLGELLDQRRGHRVRHGVGRGARQVGGHRNDRKLDVRQRRDGQLEIGKGANGNHGDGDKEGRDRTPDEELRYVHGPPPSPPAARAGSTPAPILPRAQWPRVSARARPGPAPLRPRGWASRRRGATALR